MHFSPTSIVPNAAFQGEQDFNGSPNAIPETELLRR
jgi:hypothetical protein